MASEFDEAATRAAEACANKLKARIVEARKKNSKAHFGLGSGGHNHFSLRAPLAEAFLEGARWQHARDKAEIERLQAQYVILWNALQQVTEDGHTDCEWCEIHAENAQDALAEADRIAKERK